MDGPGISKPQFMHHKMKQNMIVPADVARIPGLAVDIWGTIVSNHVDFGFASTLRLKESAVRVLELVHCHCTNQNCS